MMRIVCPSCAAEYEVPASRMSPQRKVRCARCGGAWLASETPAPAAVDPDPLEFRAEPEDEQDAESTTGLPSVTAMDRLTATAHRTRTPVGLVAAWVMTFVALAAGVSAVIIWRAPLVQAWPASSRILGRVEPVAQAPARTTAKAAEAAPAIKE
jgi:predicted Zn finger-like uncharacterized protein